MSSVLDTFQIDAALELSRGRESLWKNRVSGRTRQPPPRIPARLAGILAVKTTRDPELERQFFDDAAAHLLEQLPVSLSALPAWSWDLLPSPGR